MAKLIFDNWYEGLAPKYWQGPSSTRLGTEGMYADGVANPLSLFGYLSPANGTFTNFTNTSLLADGQPAIGPVVIDDDNSFVTEATSLYFGQDNSIFLADQETGTIVSNSTFAHTANASAGVHAGHVDESIQDVVLYQINGAKRLLYFYADNTDGDMGSYNPLTQSFTTDRANENVWSSATGGFLFDRLLAAAATAGNESRIIIAETSDNGFLYVANGSNLHKFDGTTNGGSLGTITANVVTLPFDKKFVDLRSGKGFVWCAITEKPINESGISSSERFVGVAVWDRRTNQLGFNDFIPISGVTKFHCMLFHEGILHAFTTGNDNIVQLRKFNGNEFELLYEVGGSNSEPNARKGAISMDGGIMWYAKNGNIYFYGKPFPGFKNALHIVGQPGATVGATAGFILKTEASNFTLSHDGDMAKWGLNSGGSAVDDGVVSTTSRSLPKLSNLTGMTIHWKPFTSTANINFSVRLYKNGNTTSLGSFTINYNDSSSIGYKYFPLGAENFQNVNEIRLDFTWPTGAAITSSLRMSRVEIDYLPTTKLK